MQISYNAIFEYAEDGINVSFPDLPSALTCAFSREEAIEMAQDVLTVVLHGVKYSDLPKPTQMNQFETKNEGEVVSIEIEMSVKSGKLFSNDVVEWNGEICNEKE